MFLIPRALVKYEMRQTNRFPCYRKGYEKGKLVFCTIVSNGVGILNKKV